MSFTVIFHVSLCATENIIICLFLAGYYWFIARVGRIVVGWKSSQNTSTGMAEVGFLFEIENEVPVHVPLQGSSLR